jgi:FkbM family methyltransferase
MTRTLDINGFLGHTDIVPCAMSDRHGETVELFFLKYGGMNALVGSGDSTIGAKIEVQTETINHLTADWPRVDVVKIDIEGSDEAVWRGIQRVLEENLGITVPRSEHSKMFGSSRVSLRDRAPRLSPAIYHYQW